MTTSTPENPPPPPPPPPAAGPTGPYGPDAGPRVTREQLRDVRRLRRTTGPHRTVAGVAGGVARYFDVDPLLVKVAFVILALFGGGGLFLYVALWLIVPDDATGRSAFALDQRSLEIALVGVAVLGGLIVLGTWSGQWFPWPLALVVAVGAAFLARRERSEARHPQPGPPQPGPAPYGPAPDAPAQYGDPAGGAPVPPAAYGDTAVTPSAAGHGGTAVGGSLADELASAAVSEATPPSAPIAPAWTLPPPPPPDPRKRGPVLFWITLALIALAMGVLGMVDVSGVHVSAGAYPALALGVIGAMLLVGAFFGRAGGLILLGLLTIPGLVVATAADHYDGDAIHETPQQLTDVRDSYSMSTGELVVDLTDVPDPEQLVGRQIRVDGDIGHLEVIVPEGLGVHYDAEVSGPGGINIDGHEVGGGIGTSRVGSLPGTDPGHELTLDLTLSVGVIDLTTEPAGAPR